MPEIPRSRQIGLNAGLVDQIAACALGSESCIGYSNSSDIAGRAAFCWLTQLRNDRTRRCLVRPMLWLEEPCSAMIRSIVQFSSVYRRGAAAAYVPAC